MSTTILVSRAEPLNVKVGVVMLAAIKTTVAGTMALLLFPSVAFSQTHCAKNEIDYFSCTTSAKGKVLSICGNIRNEGISNDSWVQYRFGPVDRAELTYPEKKLGSVKKFEGTYFVKYDAVSLNFITGEAFYNVDLWYDREVEGNKVPKYGGVSVTLSESRYIKIPCQSVDPDRYFSNLMHLANMLREHNGNTDFQSQFFSSIKK